MEHRKSCNAEGGVAVAVAELEFSGISALIERRYTN